MINFLKLIGVGIQMGATIYLFSLIGHWMDDYLDTESNIFKLIFIIIGFIGSLASLILQLNRINRNGK